jgi:hypothetical protein
MTMVGDADDNFDDNVVVSGSMGLDCQQCRSGGASFRVCVLCRV